MTSKRSIVADDDPLLHRARRVLMEAARLIGPLDKRVAGNAAVLAHSVSRGRILSLAADLEMLIRVLTKSRDALDLEMATRTRQITAISAYGRCGEIGRQYAREKRRRPCTE
jgi:hypothetical protein